MDLLIRRLEWEFDEEAAISSSSAMHIRELEMGEVDEDKLFVMDIIIVSHNPMKSQDIGMSFDCPICYEDIADNKRVTISCGHNFCMTCTEDLVRTCNQEPKNVSCPMCRYPCFLLETPDEKQFCELSEFLDRIQEANQEREDLNLMNAFLYYHFTHPMSNEEQVNFS